MWHTDNIIGHVNDIYLIPYLLCRWCALADNIDGLVQDCSISITNVLEILQFCTEPLIW